MGSERRIFESSSQSLGVTVENHLTFMQCGKSAQQSSGRLGRFCASLESELE